MTHPSNGPTLSVAPMEGVTGFPMRLWLWLASQPAAMTTPFLRATRTQPERRLPLLYAPELFELRGLLPYQLTPQLMACETDSFLRASALLPPDVSPAIELNCGCPSPNGAGRTAGSGILRDPAAFGATLAQLASALGPGRLAVKMRLGIASADEFAGLLTHVVRLPLARLTVHGRTRADRYGGAARWDLIGNAAAAAGELPTWASGDVVGLASLDALTTAAPAVAGVMIGRGILRNPWVFEELRRGTPVALPAAALVHALVVFALLNELSITAPEKLVARVASGRIGDACGTDLEAWERLAAALGALVLGAPRIAGHGRPVPAMPVSPTTVERVRYLWSHLRGSLPEPLHDPRLVRARRLDELVEGILARVPGPSTSLQVSC